MVFLDNNILTNRKWFMKVTSWCIAKKLRNDETIISSISVTDIVFDVFWGNGIIEALPKLKLGVIF
jgi:hypothetical protein